MNFIKICQVVDTMSGLQGEITNVENAVAAQNVIVQSVRQGFLDLQLDRMTWKFMRSTISFPTVLDKREYSLSDIFNAPTNDFGRWEERLGRRSYYIKNLETNTSTPIAYIPYDYFRDRFLRSDPEDSGEPTAVTSPPSGGLIFNIPADGIYEVSADYFVEPQSLETNEDVPILPSRFHQLLAYKALPYIGGHYSNLGISSTFALAEAKMQGQLYRDQCPAENCNQYPVV